MDSVLLISLTMFEQLFRCHYIKRPATVVAKYLLKLKLFFCSDQSQILINTIEIFYKTAASPQRTNCLISHPNCPLLECFKYIPFLSLEPAGPAIQMPD